MQNAYPHYCYQPLLCFFLLYHNNDRNRCHSSNSQSNANNQNGIVLFSGNDFAAGRFLIADGCIFRIRHNNPYILSDFNRQISGLDRAFIGVNDYGVNPTGNLDGIPVTIIVRASPGHEENTFVPSGADHAQQHGADQSEGT